MSFKNLMLSALAVLSATSAFADPHHGHGRGPVRGIPARRPVVVAPRPVFRPTPAPVRRGGFVIVNGRRVYRPMPGWRIRPTRFRYAYNPNFVFSVWLANQRRQFNYVEEIGSTRLGTTMTDVDTVSIRECGIKAIALHAKYSAAIVDTVVVELTNGLTREIDMESYLEEGTVTTWKDLPGYEACVRNVTLIGQTVGRGAMTGVQAEIEVLGLR